MALGRKTGGRKKGTLNTRTRQTVALLKRLGCDPIEGMARIAEGDVPCGVCRGIAKDPPCESCTGTGKENISPELRFNCYAEIAKYAYPKCTAPKRQPIEPQSLDEGPNFQP